MTDKPITLSIPEDIIAQAEQLARSQNTSIEDVLSDRIRETFASLPNLPSDEQAELAALAYLSDDALWTIAKEQTPAQRQSRMQALMTKNNMGKLSAEEKAELEQLVEYGDRLMLRKAQASLLLKQRGFSVLPEDLAPNA